MTKKDLGIKIHERFLPEFYFQLKEPIGYGKDIYHLLTDYYIHVTLIRLSYEEEGIH